MKVTVWEQAAQRCAEEENSVLHVISFYMTPCIISSSVIQRRRPCGRPWCGGCGNIIQAFSSYFDNDDIHMSSDTIYINTSMCVALKTMCFVPNRRRRNTQKLFISRQKCLNPLTDLTLANAGNKWHARFYSTHVHTQSASLPGMTNWQCTTSSQKLRGIFDLTVHVEAISQHGWITKFYCALFLCCDSSFTPAKDLPSK